MTEKGIEGEPVSNDELRHYIMTGDTLARPLPIKPVLSVRWRRWKPLTFPLMV
ncbi:TPA: hypothetical protein N5K94_003199 [Enterobacter hormaechei subsp. steigerwaltii]|nr:hypothetical protein [Enterobacter hormaechei subsp. steigerwaltii]